MVKKIAALLSLGGLLFALNFGAVPAFADSVCNPTYGGGQQCLSTQWFINKTVLNPSNGVFVDNLSAPGDPRFKPGDQVKFRIAVTNSGTASLGIITVTDTLPQFIDLNTVSGPGSVDKSKGIITFTINSLDAGQTKGNNGEFDIAANVMATAALPANQNTFCPLTNTVMAHADNVPDVSDTAQFCVQKNVLGVTTVPSTGSSEWILLGLGILAATGFGLLKKARVSAE